MISRVYLKDCLSFLNVDLEFDKGLNVFTGPSGAGKSILLKAILSLLAQEEVKASLGELNLVNSKIEDELYDIALDDDIVIKSIKKDKIRFFLNNQTISKKNLSSFSTKIIKYLNLKDSSDFESSKLIDFLDSIAQIQTKDFKVLKSNFNTTYLEYISEKKRLDKLLEDEGKLEDLKEYLRFEIDKIEKINPDEDEYEHLQELKKNLAKKDKIQENLQGAKEILSYRSSVSKLLELMEEESGFFDESMNELENIFEKFNDSLDELEDTNIEEVLDRIEKLSALQKRFGTITKALEYKEQKKDELESYENITFEKKLLEKKIKNLEDSVTSLAKDISKLREEQLLKLEEKINYYLDFLYLSNAKLEIETKQLDKTGVDFINFTLNGIDLNTISSGEYNRLRLALLSAMNEFNIVDNVILFLDEIDANLSGKESEAISKVLKKLADSYQIFAISHQPQLTSSTNQHYYVDKIDGVSSVNLLNKEQRVNEIARMISGESITKEALEFAKNSLEKS